MSANSHISYLFGISSNNEPTVVSFQPETLTFKRIPVPPGIKINSWSSTLQCENEIYLTGGLHPSGKVVSNECFKLNYQIQEFQEMPTFTQCRYVHASIYFNSKLYVFGGRNYGSEFESVLSHCEYFENGLWKTISPMIKRRSNFSVFIYNNKIHAIGGFTGKKNTKTIEYYDEEKNIWKLLKLKLQRGLAGFHIIPKENHQLIIVGGMTQQGSSSSCHLINLKDQTHLAISSFKEQRTIPQMMEIDGSYILFGGMAPNNNKFEVFSDQWEAFEGIQFEDESLKELFDSGLKGFNTGSNISKVGNEFVLSQNEGNVSEPDEVSFLIGNDEQPFILSVNKSICDIRLLPVPSNLRLKSYMNSCAIESELPNCRQFLVCGGIDSRISSISKEAYLVTIIFPEMKIKAKSIGKLSYYRYAAACIYKYPYVYVIGGRGYQNDLLSLHSTVERFNVEEEEWEQVAPLNEPKCSMTAQVLNERLYVFGGYIGEGTGKYKKNILFKGQISHKIEYFHEGQQKWIVLSVELPFSLEGLSSITLSNEELLIIGGKGIEGSRKEVIHYYAKELEQDSNTSGKVIGNLLYPRSLPKPLMLGNGRIMIIGGQFVDNQEASFGEILNPFGEDGLNEEDEEGILGELEQTFDTFGVAYLSMFTLVQ